MLHTDQWGHDHDHCRLGNHAPGHHLRASLTVGSLNLNSGATTNLSVTGTTAGSLFDQVAFSGGSPSLTYGGLLNLTLSGSYADQTSFGLFSGWSTWTRRRAPARRQVIEAATAS